MNTNLLFVHALSPLHAGTGQSIGAIDLAIAREKATGMPYLPGTSLKGALRARASSAANVKEVFGPDTSHASDHASSVLLGDANLLCLPVRSIAGTFAWVTSPFLLHRFVRDAKEAGLTVPSSSVAVDLDQCLVASESLAVKDGAGKEKVFFEDLDLQKKDSPEAKEWAKTLSGWLFDDDDADGAASFRKRFCIVHDDVMSFLAQHGTDVVTRVALEAETKTVKSGALWQEENLPTETMLYALVGFQQVKATPADARALLNGLIKSPIQLGGKATVGRGRCQLRLTKDGQR